MYDVIHAQWYRFYIIYCSISIVLKLYVVKKGHEQVEKTLEMKKME